MSNLRAPDPIQGQFVIPSSPYTVPGNGVQVFFYTNLTTTKTTVYQGPTTSTAWSNPIVLDSGGNLPAGATVWIPDGETLTVVYAPANDSDPPASPYRTMNDIVGEGGGSGSSGSEWITGTTPTFVGGTIFTVTGDQTSTYTVGRRVRTTNTGGTVYGTIVASVFGAVTTVTLRNDSGALDAGLSAVAYSILGTEQPSLPQIDIYTAPEVRGRLTLSPGVPVTTTDITNATSVMFAPYNGNTLWLFNTTQWRRFAFSELSTPVPASSAAYDVFAFVSSGAVALSTVAWTNPTTRAQAISSVAGVPLLAADLSRLYLGSFMASSFSGTSNARDSAKERWLFNYWNREPRRVAAQATTTLWSMNSSAAGTTRAANSDATNAVSFMLGAPDLLVGASLQVTWNPNNNSHTFYCYAAGLAFDNVTSVSPNQFGANQVQVVSTFSGSVSNIVTQSAQLSGTPGIGLHSIQWLETMVSGSGAVSVSGSSSVGRSGLFGSVQA